MEASRRRYLIPIAVYLGAVMLVGVPVFAVTASLFGELVEALSIVEALGLGEFGERAIFLLFFALAALIALQLATEAAALQLDGVAALSRGSQGATVLRHVLLFVGVVIALGASTWVGLSVVLQTDGLVLAAPGMVLALAALAVIARSSNAAVAGYRGVE